MTNTAEVDPTSLHEGSHRTFAQIYHAELIRGLTKRINKKLDKLLKLNPDSILLPIRANSETERFLLESLGFHTIGRATSLNNARQNAFDMEGKIAEVLDHLSSIA